MQLFAQAVGADQNDPVYDERWQVAHGVDARDLERVLAATPDARAVMVFTPSY
jgi:arginine decarboxylase